MRPATAAPENIQWQAVGDDVLASQTGKFANGQMISGFVLNLLSQWNLPNGGSAVAQGTLSVVQNAANQMSAAVSTMARVHDGNRRGGTGADPSAQANGGQQIAVNGVSQVTQVAGDRNVGMNAAQIDFSNGAQPLAGGSSATSASHRTRPATSRRPFRSATAASPSPCRRPPGSRRKPSPRAAASKPVRLRNCLQIAGNNQQVANQLQLHLQTAQMSPAMLRQAGVIQALQNAVNARR